MAIYVETCCSIKTTKVCKSERGLSTRSKITHRDAALHSETETCSCFYFFLILFYVNTCRSIYQWINGRVMMAADCHEKQKENIFLANAYTVK
jgi:hypothetical protein